MCRMAGAVDAFLLQRVRWQPIASTRLDVAMGQKSQLTWKREVGMMGSFRVPVNSCQASTMFSGGPRATDTQCPSDSSCRWNLHLQHHSNCQKMSWCLRLR